MDSIQDAQNSAKMNEPTTGRLNFKGLPDGLRKQLTKIFEDVKLGPTSCLHDDPKQLFSKLSKKRVLTLEWSSGKQYTGCRICYAEGYRAGYRASQDRTTILTSQQIRKPVDGPSFDTGVLCGQELGQEHDASHIWTSFKLNEWLSVQIDLDEGQYGEFPHILVSCLLYPSIRVRSKVNPMGDMSNSLRYFIPKPGGKYDQTSSGKDVTTQAIVAAFEKTSDQESLFKAIRRALDKTPTLGDDEDLAKLALSPYCSTTYVGKYWINRFLTTTKQGRSKNESTPTLDRRKLPRIEANDRVALIYIRLQGQDGSRGRSMTDENINVVLDAIIDANCCAEEAKSSARITQIVFFGDIEGKDRIGKLKTLVENRKDTADIPVLVINKPWTIDEDDYWKIYQEAGAMPLQIKYVALFLALQAQYGPRLCTIGFRSGYLDLAAFIGIPTFFVDTNDSELTKRELDLSLCMNLKNYLGRITRASQKLNTLVLIEFEAPRNPSSDRDKEELWDLASPVKRKKESSIGQRLGAALFLFMLAKSGEKDLLWQNRTRLMDKNPNVLVDLLEKVGKLSK